MSKAVRKSLTALGVSLTLGFGFVGLTRAHDGPDPRAASHGGTVAKTKHSRFEIVCAADGLKVYPYGSDGKAIDASRLVATATFYHPNSPKPWFDRPLWAASTNPGQASPCLALTMDLSTVPARGAKVSFEIAGLPDSSEPKVIFTVPFTAPPPAVITFGKATGADQAAIHAQRVCRVSGEDLFAMGGPVKVSRGGTSTFICCQHCLKVIQANPNKYLGASAASPTPGRDHDRGH